MKRSKKLLDGGVIDSSTIEDSPVASVAGAVRTEVFAIQGMTPTKVTFADMKILEDLQEAQITPPLDSEQITGTVAVPTDAADNMLPELEQAVPMPDPTLTVDDMRSYGYLDGDMLPLSKDRAVELLEHDITVYMLYPDNAEEMVFEAEDIIKHDGMFGVTRPDWDAVKGHIPPRDVEQRFLNSPTDSMAIYQLRRDAPVELRFANLGSLAAPPDPAKQGTPHYKIKQMEQRPASEWVRVPDAHEALIARQDFELVQRIKGLDTRTSPNEDTVYLFSGILICGCCGSRMTRKTNRANGKEYHYYYCPTGKKKGCAHPVMLKESSLIDCVRDSLKAYIGNIASLEALLTGIDQSSINQALAKEYSDHITDNERRLEQVLEFKARLYESLVEGMLTKEEYASYKAKYTKQAEDIRESVRVLKEKLTEVLENRSERNRWISQFTQFSTLETLDRRALIHMVQSIRVRGKKELDITFTHEDEYKKALQLLALAAQQKDYEQRKVG